MWTLNKPEETVKSSQELLRLAQSFPKWERQEWEYSGYYMLSRANERLKNWKEAEKNMISSLNIAIGWKSWNLVRDGFDLNNKMEQRARKRSKGCGL